MAGKTIGGRKGATKAQRAKRDANPKPPRGTKAGLLNRRLANQANEPGYQAALAKKKKKYGKSFNPGADVRRGS